MDFDEIKTGWLSAARSKIAQVAGAVKVFIFGLGATQLILVAVIAVIAVLYLAGAIIVPTGDVQAVAVVAPPAPEVKRVAKVEVKPAKVVAYAPKAKKALSLPQDVIDSPSIYALSATRVEPDFRPVTVSTTLDERTGEVTTYEKREPLPWVSLTRRGEIGVVYGPKFDPRHGVTMNGRLFVNQSLLDVKALRVGVSGTIDQDGTAFGGVSFAYRW